jgi:hypothetical protein
MAGSYRAGRLNACLPARLPACSPAADTLLNCRRRIFISWRQLPVHLIMQRHFSAFVCSLQ